MFLSRSLRRKLAGDGHRGVSRSSCSIRRPSSIPEVRARGPDRHRGRCPAESSWPRPTARAQITASGVASRAGWRRPTPTSCRSDRSSELDGGPDRHRGIYTVLDTGPEGAGPAPRPLHLELQRSAGLRPPARHRHGAPAGLESERPQAAGPPSPDDRSTFARPTRLPTRRRHRQSPPGAPDTATRTDGGRRPRRDAVAGGCPARATRPCAGPGSCPCPGSSTAGARWPARVRPRIMTRSASSISPSVAVSMLDVASSSSRTRRIERQRARERQQLLLADRQRRAALGDRRVDSRRAARR